MKHRTVFLIILMLALVLVGTGAASALSPYEQQRYHRNKGAVSIIGGGINGTYSRYTTDLANVLDDMEGQGMRVLPIIGHGGGQNVLDILFLRGVDMGLTQQDHLTFWKQKDPQLYGDIEQRIRYITKLYNAEYHLIARKDIKTFEDLRGKKVNFWRPWSATDIGGQTIFKLLGIEVDHSEYIDTAKALDLIKKGELAATTLLAGAPITGYAKLKPGDGLHIVPLGPDTLTPEQYKKLLEVYLPTKLTHAQYPNLIPEGQEVPSVASGVVLAVYNWKEGSERYRKVAKFVDAFFSNFDKLLKPPRHPKWKTVNLAAKVPGWTRFKAAEEWLLQAAASSRPEARQAFTTFLQAQSTAGGGRRFSAREKEALFQEFMEWRRTRGQ
jgi:TRAP transporter TAXI family solute receptor